MTVFSAAYTPHTQHPGTTLIHSMPDGSKVALFLRTGDNVLLSAIAADGVAFGSSVAFPYAVDVTGLSAIASHDALIDVWVPSVGSPVLTQSEVAYASGALASHAVHTYNPSPLATGYGLVAAVWDGTLWHVAATYTKAGGTGLCLFATPGTGTVTQAIDLGVGHAIETLSLGVGVGGQVDVCYWDTISLTVRVINLYFTGTSYGPVPASEAIVTGSGQVSLSSPVIEPDGTMTIAVNANRLVTAHRRLGSNTFLSTGVLAGNAVDFGMLRLLRDAGGDLWLLYQAGSTSGTMGPIMLIKRASGFWGPASALYPLDVTTGFYLNSTQDLSQPMGTTILTHPTSPNEVTLESFAVVSPDSPPTVTAPHWQTAAGPFLVAWTRHQANPTGNPQSAYRFLFKQGATTLFDSGFVAGTASSIIYEDETTSPPVLPGTFPLVFGGATLPRNVWLTCQVETKDSLTNGGAGTASGLSLPSSFILVDPAVVVITSLDSGGTTLSSSGGTLPSPMVTLSGTYDHPDNDACSALQLVWFDHLGTVLDTAPLDVQTPPLAHGSSFTLPIFTSTKLQNGTVVQVAVRATDATNGVVTESPHWTFTTGWTPPAPATDLGYSEDTHAGTVTLTWTNPGGIVSNRVYQQELGPSGAPETGFVLIYDVLATSAIMRPKPLTPYEYKVTTVNALGIESAS